MKKKVLIPLCLVYGTLFSSSVVLYQTELSKPVVKDAGQLLPVSVKTIEKATGERELQQIVKKANQTGDKLSIAGMQHSQGGHTYYPNAIMLDMKKYNQIVEFNPGERTITVQSGVTWDDIQRRINPYGLAVQVMQSQNIFTVGGTLSVNAHGRDIRHESLIDTVQSFRLLTPAGEIIHVSRTEYPDLFPYVIGGYGLFGVILDVTLKLTENELYQIRTNTIDYKNYSAYFTNKVKENERARMHLARISVAPDTFLRDMYVTDYLLAADQTDLSEYNQLKEENFIAVPKFFLGLSRYSNWGKNVFWEVQRSYMQRVDGTFETRNNVMRSDSAFMEYESETRTEVLQEYFVPIDAFADYIDGLRAVLQHESDFNLLNITVRYVKKDELAVLSYAKEDMFALVLLINQGRSPTDMAVTQRVIRSMIDVTLKHGGSYYLPYYSYPTKEQLREAYPRAAEFFAKKREFDPEERFVNLFYEEYGK